MISPFPVCTPQGRYTVADWLNLPEITGQRVELIDGSFVVSPLPLSDHQLCASRLSTTLAAAAPEAFEVVGPCGLRTATEVPVPDILVGDADALLAETTVLLPQQTLLVAEIVGRESRRRDYHDKPRIYAAAGIPTFLRVELVGANPPYVEVLSLRDGAYVSVAHVDAGQLVKLADPFPVEFDPARLLSRRFR
ncbi:Uma2 family endonuclease [Actinoallomurus rhizosphaericola]|uniref:Uma2 family endonuclease n=1 Tax=Actinoallomurus rhizosphaericola TaxID=2952536 RepID=UPI00209378B6|nr:Uma2 family endonuclease [Actinoallomurus rhizosphaericola]MCO5998909.1 Uma2 family endonuclease [Actinoallomurus rhizosphaericola]